MGQRRVIRTFLPPELSERTVRAKPNTPPPNAGDPSSNYSVHLGEAPRGSERSCYCLRTPQTRFRLPTPITLLSPSSLSSRMIQMHQQLRRRSASLCRSFRGVAGSLARSYASSPSLPPPPLESLRNADWIDADTKSYKIFTDNQFVDVRSGGGGSSGGGSGSAGASSSSSSESYYYAVKNPATQEVLGLVPETPNDLLNHVVDKACEAYESWRYVPVQQRQRVFFDYVRLLQQHKQSLAELICLENGKTLADAHGDVFRGLEVAETACHVATAMLGDSLMNISANMDCTSYRVPLGVASAVCPFNFPAMIPLWSFPLAVACGNSFVLKPSEKTPSAALLLARLAAEAGLPSNVLQVVHGGTPVVQQLCRHPSVKSVSFVGGNKAGESIYHEATSTGKRAQCNLGAKNHAVVMLDDILDLSATARAVSGAALGAAGQRCMALSVVVLVEGDDSSKGDQFLEELVRQAQALRVGVGWDPQTDIGPLISVESKNRVYSILDEAVRQGAVVHLDGRNHDRALELSQTLGGNFVGPTVLEIHDTTNAAYAEEIFGPVLTCVRVKTLDEAITLVNANRYGNGVALFTKSGGAARHFVNTIEAGQVGINTPIPVPLPMFSFTGNKASIRGDVNFYGASGVHFFTQLKTVTTNWPPPPPPKESSSSSSVKVKVELGGVNMPTLGGAGGGTGIGTKSKAS